MRRPDLEERDAIKEWLGDREAEILDSGSGSRAEHSSGPKSAQRAVREMLERKAAALGIEI